MNFLSEDALAKDLVPVLLGQSIEAIQLAHRIYRQHHVISHVFCNKLAFPMRFSLCMKYHVVRSTSEERLMLCALLDFAKQLERADVIACLVPCTQPYAALVWENRELLERYFVISELPVNAPLGFFERATEKRRTPT